MTLRSHLRKELGLLARDPVGALLALAGPGLAILIYAGLDVDPSFLRTYHNLRETSPTALILALGIWLGMFSMSSTSFLRERATGTLLRLRTTPYRPLEFVAAKGATIALVGLVQAGFVTLAAHAALQRHLQNAHPLQVFAALAAMAVPAVCLGLFVAAAFRSPAQVASLLSLLTVVAIALSGFLKPLADLGWVGRLASLLPFSVAYQQLRTAMETGSLPGKAFLVQAGTSLAFLAASWLQLARRPDEP